MKKLVNYSLLVILAVSTVACDKGFDELNQNKTSPTRVDPALLLNTAVINSSFPVKSMIFDMGIVQQLVTPNGGVLAGANFNQDSRDVTMAPIWAGYYQNVIKYTNDVLAMTKDIPAKSNLYN